MTREIKFRAWDEDENKMYEVQTINFFFGIIELMWWENNVHKSRDDSFNGQINSGKQDFGQYKLMQYTGLHDKNGVEIYEGDIVELFNTGGDRFVEEVKFDKYDGWTFPTGLANQCNIIGNIYEQKLSEVKNDARNP